MHSFHSHHSHDEHAHDTVNVANHDHCPSLHIHEINKQKSSGRKKLATIMGITFAFALVELVGGWMSGSLALISDAFHMLTDSSSLLLALIMAILAQKPADDRYSYGHGRWEIIGALLNGLFMVAVIVFLVFEGIERIIHPRPVESTTIIWIATVGLMINIFAAWLLHSHSHSLNTRGAFLHILGDMLGSVAAIAAGVIIYFTGMTIFDPIISIVVAAILIMPTYNLLKQTSRIILEGVPEHIDYIEVGKSFHAIPNVVAIHDLHIWSMTSEHTSLSAHVEISNMLQWEQVLADIQLMLSERFQINHITLQPEVQRNEGE
jgi:cobalt-zinc-cadmium efflux system protein